MSGLNSWFKHVNDDNGHTSPPAWGICMVGANHASTLSIIFCRTSAMCLGSKIAVLARGRCFFKPINRIGHPAKLLLFIIRINAYRIKVTRNYSHNLMISSMPDWQIRKKTDGKTCQTDTCQSDILFSDVGIMINSSGTVCLCVGKIHTQHDVSSASFFKIKQNITWILWSGYDFFDNKNN